MHSIDFEYEEPIEKRFEDLCHDLCIEGAIREEAWEKYKDVWANYSIDGDQLQWLVCSLYECCRRSISDSLGGHVVENAYVSLSRLLSTAKMSMVQFFHRIRKWADMTDMLDDMRDRVELLERQFAVSSVIFRNFGRSFGVLFQEPEVHDGPEHPTSTDLFRLTWLLFIKSRASFPAVTDDLVNSYHLLACCLDWILGSVMVSRRSDLIHLEFNGLPKEFLTAVSQKKTWSPPHEVPPCMLRSICEYNEVNYVECKTVKEHFFRPFMMRLIEKNLIKLNPPLVYGSIMESDNFELTLQNLNNNYEEYIIGTGDFDERIYLTSNAAEEIGSAGQSGVHSNLALSSDLAPSAHRYMLELSNTGFGGFTETNRRGKTNAGAVNRLNGGIGFNNPEARNQNLNQLQILLAGRSKEPSPALVDLIQSHCSVSPLSDMQGNLTALGTEFQMAYVRGDALAPTTSGSPDELALSAAQQRVHLGYQLYYLTLENILMDEVRRMEKRLNANAAGQIDSVAAHTRRIKPDLNGLLTQEIFHRSLFSCCMELVLISCDPPDHHFPWILEALNLDALHLFKVIEVVVRNVDLPRDVVKYMNQVSELILDSYAWRSQSPLWAIIKATGRAPTIEEVVPPEKLDQPGITRSISSGLMSETRKGTGLIGSSSSLSIRHSGPSPAKQARLLTSPGAGGLIRSRAGGDHLPTGAVVRHPSHVVGEDESAQATAQLLASGVDTLESDADGNLLTGSTEEVVNLNEGGAVSSSVVKRTNGLVMATSTTSSSSSNTGLMKFYPARRDSLAIFFRQLYVVASVRLRDLCDRLNVVQQRDILAKAWTCVEYAVVHETELLRDRCLDQILLCCLYGVCKVALYRPLTFVDIIQVYRMQPQSHRDIYRHVLISHVAYGRNRGEDRADLSRFYNMVFLPQMTDFLRRLVPSSSYSQSDAGGRGLMLATGGGPTDSLWTDQSTAMAPMPAYPSSQTSAPGTVLSNVLSAGATSSSTEVSQARRLASNRNVFISPVKQQQQITLSPKRVVFTIGRSSGKDLQDVNLMISSAERRASMANLTMNLKRPGGGGGSSTGFVANSTTFSMSPSNSGPRTVTVVGPSTFSGKRIDFDL